MFLDQEIVNAIQNGIASLEKADVIPMGLAIYQNHWQLFKFKALPSHPNPKNAKHGFSHPTNLDAYKISKGDADINLRGIPSVKKAHEIAREIGKQLGFTDAEIGNIVETGEIDQIILLRGGAQDFLTNDIQLGNQDKISGKDRTNLDNEELQTDEFVMNTWGGSRKGAGRHSTGRKKIGFYITDEENKKLRKYLDKLRSDNPEGLK